MKPRILIVSHFPNRTGAPIALLNILRQLDPARQWDIRLLLWRGGELASEFAALYPTYELDGNEVRPYPPVEGNDAAQASSLSAYITDWHPQLVYVNTVTNGAIVQLAQQLGIPVIIHVHETQPVFEQFATPFLAAILSCERLICVSSHVASYLREQYNVSSERLVVIQNGINPAELDKLSTAVSVETTRRMFNMLPSSLVVGGVGWVGLHKGVDLWLQMARRIVVEEPDLDVRFVWVGSLESDYAQEMQRNVPLMGLEHKVIFTDQLPNPFPLMRTFDVFVLSSRYESFGLVNLEAAYMAKPIVCFDCAGGPSEIIDDQIGILVAALDAQDLKQAVTLLLRDHDLRQRKGIAGHKRVLDCFMIQRTAHKVAHVIQQCLGKGTGYDERPPDHCTS